MKLPDLWLMILKMDNKELNRFRKFLMSPYINQDEKHIQLLDAIRDQVAEERYDREALDAILFPYKPFVYTRITNLISDLKKLLENFWVYEELKHATFYEEYLLMKVMKRKGLSKQFSQGHTRIEKLQGKKSLLDEQSYLYSYQKDALVYEESEQSKHLHKKIKSLHLFYVLSMLRSVCQDLDKRELIDPSKDNLPHKFFIQYILENQKLYWHDRLIRLYIRVLRIMIGMDNRDLFPDFILDWKGQDGEDVYESKWEFFQLLHNHVKKKLQINAGSDYKTEVFSLYESLPEETWIFRKKYMNDKVAKEVFHLAIDLGREEWVKAFLGAYQVDAESLDPLLSLRYFQAVSQYQLQKELRNSLQSFRLKDYEGHVFWIDIYLLMQKLLFELYEEQKIIENWEIYPQSIKKSKTIGPEEKEKLGVFTRHLKKLMKLRKTLHVSQRSVFLAKQKKLLEELAKSKQDRHTEWIANQAQALHK